MHAHFYSFLIIYSIIDSFTLIRLFNITTTVKENNCNFVKIG